MDIEKLFNTSVNELDRLLSTKTVIGEPMTVNGNTLIPLVSVGFGFGVGGGEGGERTRGEGSGGGLGGGGGVKPVALVVVNPEGVRIERVEAPRASALERMAATIGQMARREERKEGGGEPKSLPEERS